MDAGFVVSGESTRKKFDSKRYIEMNVANSGGSNFRKLGLEQI